MKTTRRSFFKLLVGTAAIAAIPKFIIPAIVVKESSKGLAAWLPEPPNSNDMFFGVDRSSYPIRLSIGSVLTIEMIQEAANKCAAQGLRHYNPTFMANKI